MLKKIIAILVILLVIVEILLFIVPQNLAEETTISKEPNPEKEIDKLIGTMSLEEQVQQMFFVCYYGSEIDPEEISENQIGGCILFASFFENRNQETAAADIRAIQAASHIPMLIGVDEEGGTVVRVSKYSAYRSSPFESPQALYKKGGLALIKEDTLEKCRLLDSLGINVNLAPVCDVSQDPKAFMYPRTLGQDAPTTADYITTVVQTMNKEKMGSALKHFPGYGGNVDTHTGIATDKRDYETFVSQEFLPFQAGIDAGAPCVLLSHNIVTCMDAAKPASLSKNVHDILREELNFDGVIMTDDLTMDGVSGYTGNENIAVAAIQAGNDLICTGGDYAAQVDAVMAAINKGTITTAQITQSARRILLWKQQLGLI